MNPAAYEGGGPFDHDEPKDTLGKKAANKSQVTWGHNCCCYYVTRPFCVVVT